MLYLETCICQMPTPSTIVCESLTLTVRIPDGPEIVRPQRAKQNFISRSHSFFFRSFS